MNSRWCCCVHLFIILSAISAAAGSDSFSSKEKNEQDRISLLALREEFIAGGTSSDDSTVLNSWNASTHFCQWQGITCGKRHKRVIAMQLVQQNLKGVVSPSVGNLTFLRMLYLMNNSLRGEIPKEIGKLRRLQYLDLSTNSFQGRIPIELSNCSNLIWLGLYVNNLTGRIPFQFGSLLKISTFYVFQNNLAGEMPSFLRNLSSLSQLHLGNNYFHGGIQHSLQGLSKLTLLSLPSNDFSGTISSLYNLSSLQYLDIATNHFTGILAQDMDIAFPRLTFLSFPNNNFTGTIPSSLFNISGLYVIQLGGNKFTGHVPNKFGKLKSLWMLQLSDNQLGSKHSDDWNFIDSLTNCTALKWLILAKNMFGGQLPDTIANFSYNLQVLEMRQNYITGYIPEGIGELSGLTFVDFGKNLLTGTIPASIGKLTNVSTLHLSENNLHGGIPSSIGNLTNLSNLDLSTNSMDGIIPAAIGNCTSMQVINISRNHFTGNLPDDVFTQFRDLRSCNVSYNSFDGMFPSAFGKLRAFSTLDASYNNFSGEIQAQLDLKGKDFKALVFDFMSNGNLDNWLHFGDKEQLEARVPLTLAKRFEIATDVGYALDYLHNGCETPIVHCDLKPSNILLDDNMVAHVGDFGLAKLIHGVTENHSGGESLSAAITGSIGYVAPEYGMGASISVQGDIYSYGILLLELITGKRPSDDMFNNEMSLRSFIERAIPDHVEEIVDEYLVNELHEATATQRNPEETKLQWHTYLISFLEVGLSCSAESPRDRMDIQSAIRCLKGIKSKYDLVARLQ
ncbi:hypothetical protein QQ045_031365 [Rhodiola kirilowii]